MTIRVDLTKPQQRTAAESGYVLLSEKQAASVRGKLNNLQNAGGRPVVLRACKHCGKEFSARELRAHVPHCPQR
jgi:hypothetical protein